VKREKGVKNESIQDAIRVAHDRIARRYADYDRGGVEPFTLGAWGQALIERNIASLLARYAPPAERLTVLDAGCGNGAWSEMYAARFRVARIVGVDFAAHMLAVARERAARAGYPERLDLIQAPLERMAQVADASVDLVHFFGVVEHVDDPGPILREFSRVLRPGGLVIFDVPRRWSWSHVTFVAFSVSPSRWGTTTTWRDRLRFREKQRYYRFRRVRSMSRLGAAAGLHLVARRPNAFIWVCGPPMYLFYLAAKYFRRHAPALFEAMNRIVSVLWPAPAGELLLLRKGLTGIEPASPGQGGRR
jgi:ubiquinone/menaquinone biosynthesis C-methylase UbiE